MEITYTHPKSNVVLTVTGTSDELAPIVFQLINDLPETASIKTTPKKKAPHSSSDHYRKLRKQVIADFSNGLSRDEIMDKYPISRATMNTWIRNANLSSYKGRKTTRKSATSGRKTASRRTPNSTLPPTQADLHQIIESISLN